MIKKWMPVLTAACVLCTSVLVPAAGREVKSVDRDSLLKYELEETGTFAEENRLTFMRDAILSGNGEYYSFLSITGETIVPEAANVDYLGAGLYKVTEPLEEDDVNKTGLFTLEGDTLFPCEAASIVMPHNREEGDARFLEVIYTTEETDSKDEAIIYFTEDTFSISADEDDILYKGYAKIFDVEAGAFVEGVELTDSRRYGFYDLGESFVIEHDGVATMYGPDGSQLWESTGMVTGDTYSTIIVFVGTKYYIVDSSAKEIYTSDASIYDVSAADDLFIIYDAEGDTPYRIIDKEGNRILEDTFSMVYEGSPTAFYVKRGENDDDNSVVAADGTVLTEKTDMFQNVIGGYSYFEQDDETVTLVTPKDVFPDLQSGYNLFLGKNDKIVILNTGEELTAIENMEDANVLRPGLLTIRVESSQGSAKTLYDQFTGEELLPAQYDDIEIAGDYILASRKDSTGARTWEVYRVNLVPAE